MPLGAAYVQRVISLLELIDALDAHETRFSVMVADKLGGHAGYQAIQQLPGVGPILGAVFVAEVETCIVSPIPPGCVRGPG